MRTPSSRAAVRARGFVAKGGGAGALAFPSFPALSAAYAAGRGLGTLLSDSTGLGQGAGGADSSGGDALNLTHYMISGLNTSGVMAIEGCANFGLRNYWDSFSKLQAYYTGSGMSVAATGVSTDAGSAWMSAYGRLLNTNGSGSFSFSPGMTWDKAEVITMGLYNYSAGSVSIDIGGADLVTSTLLGNAEPWVKKLPVTAPRGANTLYARNAGYIMCVGAVRCWDSTVKHIQIENMGNPGWTTADWISTTNPYSPLNLIPLLGSHLFIIGLGFNDQNQGVSDATYKTNLRTLAQACKATGADVVLAIPHICQSGSSYQLSAGKRQVIIDLSAELNLPSPIDFTTSALVNTDYFAADGAGVHLVGSGYAKNAAVAVARLRS